MTINEARLIREIKKGCTYRRLAEIYYSPSQDGHGIQGYGEDLCKTALKILYPKYDVWKKGPPKSARFGLENKSDIGDFYWWE